MTNDAVAARGATSQVPSVSAPSRRRPPIRERGGWRDFNRDVVQLIRSDVPGFVYEVSGLIWHASRDEYGFRSQIHSHFDRELARRNRGTERIYEFVDHLIVERDGNPGHYAIPRQVWETMSDDGRRAFLRRVHEILDWGWIDARLPSRRR